MEEDIKNMSKEELLEYLEKISKQLDNIALDQIPIAISELHFFRDRYENLLARNKELEKNQLSEEEKTVIQAYRNYIKLSGSKSWVICNPNTMYSDYFIHKSKIEEKIKELKNKRQHISEGSLDYQLRQYNYIGCKIDILQELMEEK